MEDQDDSFWEQEARDDQYMYPCSDEDETEEEEETEGEEDKYDFFPCSDEEDDGEEETEEEYSMRIGQHESLLFAIHYSSIQRPYLHQPEEDRRAGGLGCLEDSEEEIEEDG